MSQGSPAHASDRPPAMRANIECRGLAGGCPPVRRPHRHSGWRRIWVYALKWAEHVPQTGRARTLHRVEVQGVWIYYSYVLKHSAPPHNLFEHIAAASVGGAYERTR